MATQKVVRGWCYNSKQSVVFLEIGDGWSMETEFKGCDRTQAMVKAEKSIAKLFGGNVKIKWIVP